MCVCACMSVHHSAVFCELTATNSLAVPLSSVICMPTSRADGGAFHEISFGRHKPYGWAYSERPFSTARTA